MLVCVDRTVAAKLGAWRLLCPHPGRTSLALLLGAARARVLGSLGQPRTTGDVADALGIAPSTASEHLTALVRAGAAARERTGRVVEYRLTDAGAALLDLFPLDSVPARPAVPVDAVPPAA